MKHKKYLVYSDTHLNFAFPWTQYKFVEHIQEENPDGLFLLGDIACGLTIEYALTLLASNLENTKIYFVVGNHDHYSISFKRSQEIIRKVCSKYSNLHWISDTDILELNQEVALVGDDGFYDARCGRTQYLAYNFDWIMIEEFRKLSSFEEKLSYTRKLADQSSANIKTKLEKALENYQTVYIMTHMPPWKEACRGFGTPSEEFWLPYNINYHLGLMLEEVMADRGNQNIKVFSGHTHIRSNINISHNIECFVQNGKYLGPPLENNLLFI